MRAVCFTNAYISLLRYQVNKRLAVLVSAKVVWVELLQRLALPVPSSEDIAHLGARDIERLAVRAVRLEANWSSSSPSPARVWSLPVDSVVTVMAMCRGVLFTAHKDGMLRCWRDLSPDTRIPQSDREDARRVDTLKPEAKIVKFTLLQVCSDPSDSHFVVAYAGDGVDRRYVSLESHGQKIHFGLIRNAPHLEPTAGYFTSPLTGEPSRISVHRSRWGKPLRRLRASSRSPCLHPRLPLSALKGTFPSSSLPLGTTSPWT